MLHNGRKLELQQLPRIDSYAVLAIIGGSIAGIATWLVSRHIQRRRYFN